MTISVNRIIDNVLNGYSVHSDECTKEQYRNVADTLRMVFDGIYEIREYEGRICLHKVESGKLAVQIVLYADIL